MKNLQNSVSIITKILDSLMAFNEISGNSSLNELANVQIHTPKWANWHVGEFWLLWLFTFRELNLSSIWKFPVIDVSL